MIQVSVDARPDHCLHGVTVRILRGKLHHQVRVHTEDPVKQSKDHQREDIIGLRGPTLDASIPWMFELEIREDTPQPEPKHEPESTPQIYGPLAYAKTKSWEQHLKRKREDPSP